MRNKFVYSCSIKIHASRFDELLESISCVLLSVEEFSCKKLSRSLKKWYSIDERSGNIADESKLCSPIHLAYEVLVVLCAVRRRHKEELTPFC